MEWKIVVDTACDFREIPNKAENVTYEGAIFIANRGQGICRYSRSRY